MLRAIFDQQACLKLARGEHSKLQVTKNKSFMAGAPGVVYQLEQELWIFEPLMNCQNCEFSELHFHHNLVPP
jgi:hypothetical protein